MANENFKLKEIDKKIDQLNHALQALYPVYHQVERRVKTLEIQIQILKDERLAITEGQLSFDSLDF